MIEMEETTKSGIVLPGSAMEKTAGSRIVAVGPGGVVDGKDVVMQVKPGDRVLIQQIRRYRSKKWDNVEYTILKQGDILAIVE
jgi:chaperonin GroES